MLCGGIIEYINDDISYGLIVIGDDVFTTEQEGFQNREWSHLKVRKFSYQLARQKWRWTLRPQASRRTL